MKTIFTILLFSGLSFISNAQVISIQDINFVEALLNHDPIIDMNGDGQIQITEALTFSDTLDVSNSDIENLSGVEYFKNISGLDCRSNQLISLNLDSNLVLKKIDCSINQITSLNVSQHSFLLELWCFSNPLGTLDISNNTALIKLHCGGTKFLELDVTNNPLITNLSCSGNQLEILNLSNNPLLTELYCRNNLFTTLSLNDNPLLVDLDCQSCQLSSIDVSNNLNLKYFRCERNFLTSININNNPSLTHFTCSWNNLDSLNVSNNTSLIALGCSYNKLKALDVSSNSTLKSLNVGQNELISLNVNNGYNINFYYFYALINPLLECIKVDNANWSTENWDKIDSVTSFNENCESVGVLEDISNSTFSLFPNPATNSIQLLLNTLNKETKTFELIDLSGRVIDTKTTKVASNITWDISTLEAGYYIVKLKSSKENNSQSFIKR
jgi:Leucine-rich repeat (LRR) protein